MKFQLRHLIGFVACLAAMMAYWRHGVDCRSEGREELRRELESTGVVKASACGFTVPLDNRLNLHVIQNIPRREGVAVVELWNCQHDSLPTLVRTLEIPLETPEESIVRRKKTPTDPGYVSF